MEKAIKIMVSGMVQGVGFRPAVAELAESLKLKGYVKNIGGIVEIVLCGDDETVNTFVQELHQLPVGDIQEIEIKTEQSSYCFYNFQIIESSSINEKTRLLPVDFSICDCCKAELFDKNNRRYRYPFISCTNCGPRFSIQKAVPYDRNHIVMDEFPMCDSCKEEYQEKGNRRRHAQTIACYDCGPVLKLIVRQKKGMDSQIGSNQQKTDSMIAFVVKALKEDKIIAIKDIGGFHFACSVSSQNALKRLREFKNRDQKPFAVMFYDLNELKEHCYVSKQEEQLLVSNAKPIVLLNRKKEFTKEVCGRSDRIGAFLPCNPLQLLILKETGPLVMTSGNLGGEPIIIDEQEMEQHLKQGCPDVILSHNREILTPLDDSIYQMNGEIPQLLRRARGFVPDPIVIDRIVTKDTFAAGGDLKASFALAKNNRVYMSQYFGDLDDVRCMKRRSDAYDRMKKLFAVSPEVAVADLHPLYLSSKGIKDKVQHHKAHVASVIAEHGLKGKVLGVAWDGTGFGEDQTIWGSEIFVFQDEKIERRAHLSTVKLLGGDSSAKDGDKTLFSYLLEMKERGLIQDEEYRKILKKIELKNSDLLEQAWRMNINTIDSSSMGRLFDAVSALLDICHYNSYEGESAIALEQAAHDGKKYYNRTLSKEKPLFSYQKNKENIREINACNALVTLYRLRKREELSKELLAYFFHHELSNCLILLVKEICQEYNISQVALSGGTFLNRILFSQVKEGLEKAGFQVFTNQKVPCGDGGIALGQVYLSTFLER